MNGAQAGALIGALIGGAVIGSLLTWHATHDPVEVLHGRAYVDARETTIAFTPGSGIEQEKRSLGLVPDWKAGGSWHYPSGDRLQTCLKPLKIQTITVGIVDIPATDRAPGGPRVVWLECLDA